MEISYDGNCLVTGGIFGDEGVMLKGLLALPVNVVLGMNGSGKSTIARFFDNKRIENNDESLFVFNEDYINDNFRIASQGIGTIAMFGKQVADDDERQKKQEIVDAKTSRIEEVGPRIVELKATVASCQASITERLDAKDNSYSRRRSDSKGYKNNYCKSAGKDGFDVKGVIDKMLELKKEEIDKVSVHVAESLAEEVGKSKSDRAPLVSLLDIERIRKEIIEECRSLLMHSVRKPELNAEDEHLLYIASTASLSHYLGDTKKIINEGMTVCPVCHQPLLPGYLDELKKKVEKVLNHEAEEYQNRIKEAIGKIQALLDGWQNKEDSLDNLEGVSGFSFEGMKSVRLQLNLMKKELESLQNQLNAKHNDLFNASSLQGDILSVANDFQKEQESLLQAIEKHNRLREEAVEKRDHFEKVNIIAAYHECMTDVETYRKASEELAGLESEKEECEECVLRLRGDILRLSEGKEDYSIAVEKINDYLFHVFCEERITLEYKGTHYAVKMYDSDIMPCQLSTGERNALALAYFFASINKGKSEDEAFTADVLVVVDDPVTSFDQDNVMGMWKMMEKVFNAITENRKSKVLLLTHDVSTAGYFGDIYGFKRDDASKTQIKFLENKGLWNKNLFEGDYWNLINDVSRYGFDDSEEVDNGIINKMRRLLETFCSFNYKRQPDFEELANMDLPMHQNDHRYFEACHNRFFLNSGSHDLKKEKVLTTIQKQTMARAVIYYLYLQDERHIAAYNRNKYELIKDREARGLPIIIGYGISGTVL